ncbi:MAG TPA: GNAT family protein [Candidatus Cybelea sp.]|nr:GNAT family protein [Candidatus Cybelea sp.]
MIAPASIPLETERLELIPLAERFADAMYDGLQSPELYEYMADSPPPSRQWLRERYRRLEAGRSSDSSEVWLNWLLREKMTGHFVGHVQATVKDRSALVAYLLFVKACGAGYAREAVARMLLSLERDYGVEEFAATVHVENQRSIRLLERLGFTRRSFTKNAEIIRGGPTDEYRYTLTGRLHGHEDGSVI